MSYRFYKILNAFILSMLAIVLIFPIVYFNYILKFTYDFNWGIVILFTIAAITAIVHYILKPVFIKLNSNSASGNLKKKFIKNSSQQNDTNLISIQIREKIVRKMLNRGVNNFEKMNFSNLDLNGFDFRRTNFTYCLFHNCNLSNTKLDKAFFDSCIFDKTDFTNATLKQATITGINMRFENAIMTNVNLDNAKVIRSLPYSEKPVDLWFSELEDSKVTGIKEIKEKYICQSFAKRSFTSIDSFLIIPRLVN